MMSAKSWVTLNQQSWQWGPSWNGDDESDSFSVATRLGSRCYQLSRKSNPVFRMLLLVLNWEKVGLAAGPSSTLSFSALVALCVGLDNMLEENISSTVLLTEGSVL